MAKGKRHPNVFRSCPRTALGENELYSITENAYES